jgi:hypothetical protein
LKDDFETIVPDWRRSTQYSSAEALKFLAASHRVDIVLPTIEVKEIWLRRITTSDENRFTSSNCNSRND